MQTKLIPLLVLSLSLSLTLCKKEAVACGGGSDSKDCRSDEPGSMKA